MQRRRLYGVLDNEVKPRICMKSHEVIYTEVAKSYFGGFKVAMAGYCSNNATNILRIMCLYTLNNCVNLPPNAD